MSLMANGPQREMRSSLELLLLALIRDGVATPYEIKTRAGISIGSAIPALRRLEQDGLVTASDTGVRNSRRFALNAKGRGALQKDWIEHLASQPTDVDSIVRITYLALLNHALDKAASFLEGSADRFRQSMREKKRQGLFGIDGSKVDDQVLRQLRARIEESRVLAELEELSAISKELRNYISVVPKTRTAKKRKRS